MKKLAILLTMLPLVALADLVDPIDTMPGIGKPFSPAFLIAVCLVVGGLILICHSISLRVTSSLARSRHFFKPKFGYAKTSLAELVS